MDLTKNKKSEKNSNSAERFEKLYTMLLNAIPSSVLMIDQDLRIVSANRNYLTKNRRTESNTIHRRLEEIFPAVILEQIDIIGQIHEVFNRNEATRGQRMSYRSPSVPMRIFYYRIIPFSWKGVVENVMFLMDDVTEQIRLSEEVRRVERHMASVFESASDIILSTDMDGRILSWNPAAEKISSYTFNEVKKKRFFNYIAQEFQKDIKQQFLKMMNTQRPQMAEWDFVTKNGSKIPVAWVSSPMKNERSQPTGIVIVGRDLTERRKLKIQLLRSQKYAALGVMAGGIAHEIRNPLAICSSAAQFLMDDDTTPEFRMECTEKIYTAIQRASIIIENLLRFARPTGKYDMMPVNLPDLIQETLVLISNQAKIQKVELIVDIPEATVAVNCNASLLQQVFINIFLNGIQALPHGGTLSVTLENLGKNVFVLITDNGQGISKENIDKIFDPFYTTSPVGQGTGLGLSICYSIVKQHNGFIGVESVEGKGSTFTVRLPVLSALTRTNRKSYR